MLTAIWVPGGQHDGRRGVRSGGHPCAVLDEEEHHEDDVADDDETSIEAEDTSFGGGLGVLRCAGSEEGGYTIGWRGRCSSGLLLLLLAWSIDSL